MAAEIAPRKINGSIGSRIRVIFGETGKDWLLILDKDDGDRQWQESCWKGPGNDLEKQVNNCAKKGRTITSVDFYDNTNGCGGYKSTSWYIEGTKEGFPTHRW